MDCNPQIDEECETSLQFLYEEWKQQEQSRMREFTTLMSAKDEDLELELRERGYIVVRIEDNINKEGT